MKIADSLQEQIPAPSSEKEEERSSLSEKTVLHPASRTNPKRPLLLNVTPENPPEEKKTGKVGPATMQKGDKDASGHARKEKTGAGDEIRTHNINLGKVALYH